jgi:hypothetical protein
MHHDPLAQGHKACSVLRLYQLDVGPTKNMTCKISNKFCILVGCRLAESGGSRFHLSSAATRMDQDASVANNLLVAVVMECMRLVLGVSKMRIVYGAMACRLAEGMSTFHWLLKVP